MVSIYALVDPVTKFCRYVGKTKGCPQKRLRSHLSDATRHPQIPRFRWMNNLRRDGLSPECIELESVSDEQWQDAEQFWIANMRAMGSPLLNATGGGDGLHDFSHTQKTRERMSETAKRIAQYPDLAEKRSAALKKAYSSPQARASLSARLRESHARPEVRAKLSAAAKVYANRPEVKAALSARSAGRKVTDETKRKLRESALGRKMSPEAREKIASAHRGVKRSEETKAKMRAAITPEMRVASAARLHEARMNQTPEQRAAISRRMTELWAKRRAEKKL